MVSSTKRVFALAVLIASAFASAVLADDIPLRNWTVPSSRGGIHTMTDVGFPATFVPVAPCRIVDTRGPASTFGGPSITGGTSRNFPLSSNGACPGIPLTSGVGAYSLNFTTTNSAGGGALTVYPQGGAFPPVSTMNFEAGRSIANAAVVPAGTGGGVTVFAGTNTTDVIIDINGYFLDARTAANAGEFAGIYGNYGAGGLLFAQNSSTTGGNSSVRGQAINSASGIIGVLGESLGGGATYGVKGLNASTTTCSAAVFGQGGPALPCTWVNAATSPGVYGTSPGLWGILGLSSNTGSSPRGVQGTHTDTAGNFITSGVLGYAGTSGVFSFNDITKSGVVSFVAPDARNAQKQIVYAAIESPEVNTFYRTRVRADRGIAIINIPQHFQDVTEPDGMSVQAMPLGDMATFAVVRMEPGRIVLRASRDVDMFVSVYGIRKGYSDFQAVSDNIYFVPSSAGDQMKEFPASVRQLLIQNKILNSDGTVNMETAETMGWAKQWREQEAAAAEAADARVRAAPERANGNGVFRSVVQ